MTKENTRLGLEFCKLSLLSPKKSPKKYNLLKSISHALNMLIRRNISLKKYLLHAIKLNILLIKKLYNYINLSHAI